MGRGDVESSGIGYILLPMLAASNKSWTDHEQTNDPAKIAGAVAALHPSAFKAA